MSLLLFILSAVISFFTLYYFCSFFPRCHLLLNFLGSLEDMSKILFYPTKISFFLVLITYLLNTKISSKDPCLSIYLYSINSSLNKRNSLWLCHLNKNVDGVSLMTKHWTLLSKN